jgi:hypothetical protein
MAQTPADYSITDEEKFRLQPAEGQKELIELAEEFILQPGGRRLRVAELAATWLQKFILQPARGHAAATADSGGSDRHRRRRRRRVRCRRRVARRMPPNLADRIRSIS